MQWLWEKCKKIHEMKICVLFFVLSYWTRGQCCYFEIQNIDCRPNIFHGCSFLCSRKPQKKWKWYTALHKKIFLYTNQVNYFFWMVLTWGIRKSYSRFLITSSFLTIQCRLFPLILLFSIVLAGLNISKCLHVRVKPTLKSDSASENMSHRTTPQIYTLSLSKDIEISIFPIVLKQWIISMPNNLRNRNNGIMKKSLVT